MFLIVGDIIFISRDNFSEFDGISWKSFCPSAWKYFTFLRYIQATYCYKKRSFEIEKWKKKFEKENRKDHSWLVWNLIKIWLYSGEANTSENRVDRVKKQLIYLKQTGIHIRRCTVDLSRMQTSMFQSNLLLNVVPNFLMVLHCSNEYLVWSEDFVLAYTNPPCMR